MERRKVDRVFISYSHKDKLWRDELLKHLRPLDRNGEIELWVDEGIEPGEKWDEFIETGLTTSRTAILLVSQNFQDSQFISKSELPKLKSAAAAEQLKLFWIPLTDCILTDEIGEFQAASNPANPLDGLPETKRNSIFARLARDLRDHVAMLRKEEAAYLASPEYLEEQRKIDKAAAVEAKKAAKKAKKERRGDKTSGVFGRAFKALLSSKISRIALFGILCISSLAYFLLTRDTTMEVSTLGDMKMVLLERFDDADIYVSKTVVRKKDYAKFAEARKDISAWETVGKFIPKSSSDPMENVNFKEAQFFCSWLGKKEGVNCRLPTVLELEKVFQRSRSYKKSESTFDICKSGDDILWFNPDSNSFHYINERVRDPRSGFRIVFEKFSYSE